jgi:hypothetical protein
MRAMLKPRHRTHRSAPFLGLLAGLSAVVLVVPATARADVGAVNKLYEDIIPALRSDEVLLPALAAMTPPPKSVGTRESATLLMSGMQGFEEAVAWTQGDTQKAVLEALKKVTQERDFRKAYAFGQPYGADVVDPKLVRAGLYTELGDPALLPGARFLYMPALENLVCLANVEANRLVGDKKPGEALEVLTNLLYFSRQMCDRAFFAESRWGLQTFIDTSERLRDVACLDQKSQKALTTEDVRKVLDRLDMSKPSTAYVDIDRMRFPSGDLLGFQQVADRLFNADGSPNDAQFASTLARLRSSNRPLRLFSEAGKWSAATVGHAPKGETLTAGERSYSDWRTRWDLSWFDKQQRNVQDYVQLDPARFAAVRATIPNMYDLYLLRQKARVEQLGTRNALAVVGATIQRGMIPPLLNGVRPQWLPSRTDLGVDPFNVTVQDRGSAPPLKYLIPPEAGIDTTVVLANESTFRVLLKNDVFVLYSLGSDLSDERVSRVQNSASKLQVKADYLLYPPVVSLYRQSLIDLGQLK